MYYTQTMRDGARTMGITCMSKTKFAQALMAAEPSVDVRRPGGRGNQIWWCNGIKLAGLQPSLQSGEKVVRLRPGLAVAVGAGAA